MYSQIEKSNKNKCRATTNNVEQKKNSEKQVIDFVDNRTETVAQRKRLNALELRQTSAAIKNNEANITQSHQQNHNSSTCAYADPRSPIQLKKILNLGSGTDIENLLKPDTILHEDNEDGGDNVINVDSGHMLLAQILKSKDCAFFTCLEKTERLEIKYSALKSRTKLDDESEIQKTEAYKDFVLRELFNNYAGKQDFLGLLKKMSLIDEGIGKAFQMQIQQLEATGGFKHGFVEDLSIVDSPYRYQGFDEVHVISALGFDLISDEKNLQQLANILKPGSKLVITAEKTGMPSKALKTEKKIDSKWPIPVITETGKPVIKNGLPLLYYFDYNEGESEIGTYNDVFKGHYKGVSTSHTTGGGFDGSIPFVRLVFTFRGNIYDLDLARFDHEQAKGIEGYENLSFEEFLLEYSQDM